MRLKEIIELQVHDLKIDIEDENSFFSATSQTVL